MFKYDRKNEKDTKIITDDNGHYYKGEVKEDGKTKHGVGIQISTTGTTIQGHWEDGELHGRCRSLYTYGDREDVTMDHGKKHGYRVWHASDGSKTYQEWDQDALVNKFEDRISMEDLLKETEQEFNDAQS